MLAQLWLHMLPSKCAGIGWSDGTTADPNSSASEARTWQCSASYNGLT